MDRVSDQAFWATAVADYLRPLFAAAILTNEGSRKVATWLTRQDFAKPEQILRDHGLTTHANRLADFGSEPAAAATAIRAAMLSAVSR
jgi:hypothetical protein